MGLETGHIMMIVENRIATATIRNLLVKNSIFSKEEFEDVYSRMEKELKEQYWKDFRKKK